MRTLALVLLVTACEAPQRAADPDLATPSMTAVHDGGEVVRPPDLALELPAQCPCPLGSYCELASNSCKRGCLGNDHCPAGERCDTSAYVCRPSCDHNAPNTCPFNLACKYLNGNYVCAGCRPGFDDCNHDPADGCEASLDSLDHCGECGKPAVTMCLDDADHDFFGVSGTAKLSCTCKGGIPDNLSWGNDCDDKDSRVHPGSRDDEFFTTEAYGGGWDFDCDGKLSRKYLLAVDGQCSSWCDESFWSVKEPACGETGQAWNCNYPRADGSCAIGSKYPLVQACR
jgi:hypothetical protein